MITIYHKKNPARFMLSGYLFMLLWGTFVLLLPQSTVAGSIRLIDALFTATSAVCVTGLTVVDTGTTFTLIGQITILILIQLGGIGIAFFAILFGLVFTGKINIGQKSLFSSTMTPHSQWDIWGVFRIIFTVTFTLEAIGTVLIALPMLQVVGGDPLKAFYYGLFHSVSAFCNAGFSLLGENLMAVKHEPLVVIPVMCLIVLGGIGFFVIDDVLQVIRTKRRHPLTLHTKIVLTTTVFLIASGAVLLYLLEGGNTFSGESTVLRIMDSIFMGITPRTAGFNTVTVTDMLNPSVLVLIVFMFIGASPASTGGGVKTSTFAIIALLIRSRFRGSESVSDFKRTIPSETVLQAHIIMALSTALIVVMTFLIVSLNLVGAPPRIAGRGIFISSLFETVSAFGTVGLSMGITPYLSWVGKFFVSLTMFIGRVGPLTILLALQKRARSVHFAYSEENLMVG
jgi:trk system potassium uptake protein TrkH